MISTRGRFLFLDQWDAFCGPISCVLVLHVTLLLSKAALKLGPTSMPKCDIVTTLGNNDSRASSA